MRFSLNGLVPLGYQQFTSLAGVTKLTVPTGAEVAMISVTMSVAGYVRYRDDASAASVTGAIGMTIPSGQNPFLYSGDLSTVSFIVGATGTLTSMDVLYYGVK